MTPQSTARSTEDQSDKIMLSLLTLSRSTVVMYAKRNPRRNAAAALESLDIRQAAPLTVHSETDDCLSDRTDNAARSEIPELALSSPTLNVSQVHCTRTQTTRRCSVPAGSVPLPLSLLSLPLDSRLSLVIPLTIIQKSSASPSCAVIGTSQSGKPCEALRTASGWGRLPWRSPSPSR